MYDDTGEHARSWEFSRYVEELVEDVSSETVHLPPGSNR